MRRFSSAEISRCESWFDIVETTDMWVDTGEEKLKGESQAFRVRRTTDGFLGAAKPAIGTNPDGTFNYRAAHEKLAFDLAHVLQLPVPPVVLWDRGAEHGENRYFSIAAWAFKECVPWHTYAELVRLEGDLVESARPVLSAMIVFHAWINDDNRVSDHVQVNTHVAGRELALAFIDHAGAMQGRHWPTPPRPKYKPLAPFDREAITQTISRIDHISEGDLRKLVARIPNAYLPGDEKESVLNNLISRRPVNPDLREMEQ